MYLEQFAPRWREFHQQQMHQTRVLVVDDEPNVGKLLSRTLKRLGFTVQVALSVAEAWPIIEAHELDLILVDKTMPKESGLVLLERLQKSEYDIPAILITGDASVETVDEALRLGAEDYISKPFVSIEHLVRRLRSVLDKRISALLFDVMLADLSKTVLSGTSRSDEFTRFSQSLLEIKVRLGKRPACAVIDVDEERREERRAAIYDAGVIAVSVCHPDIEAVFGGEHPPLVVAVSLECEGTSELIAELRRQYPQLEVLAFANETSVETALQAISAGASDFTLLGEEGITACTQRIDRLARQARRHQLYLEVVKVLYRAACEVCPDMAENLIFAAKGEDRSFILNQTG